MKRNKFAVMVATLMLLTGCGAGTDNDNYVQSEQPLNNHPRTYPDGYMTEDLKYMDDWQTRNHQLSKTPLRTLERFLFRQTTQEFTSTTSATILISM